MEAGKNPGKVKRQKYKNLSKDLRKLERNEIRGSDFGLGMPKKKLKMENKQNTINYTADYK